ncbi:hypothetical protein RRG08_018050 [Elysia crispata]|uniref:Uncharacterized protein n=1 Tax=Elysia crispata TaxID=231223 RepID=A0AAE0ZD14_9GAST|nr:hypothetical protein RRG08_018050 [Elysia crispata]
MAVAENRTEISKQQSKDVALNIMSEMKPYCNEKARQILQRLRAACYDRQSDEDLLSAENKGRYLENLRARLLLLRSYCVQSFEELLLDENRVDISRNPEQGCCSDDGKLRQSDEDLLLAENRAGSSKPQRMAAALMITLCVCVCEMKNICYTEVTKYFRSSLKAMNSSEQYAMTVSLIKICYPLITADISRTPEQGCSSDDHSVCKIF